MGVGVSSGPITATRGTCRIEHARVVDSKFTDDKGRELKQFATELRVISGTEERDGETFSDWFTFPANGDIGRKTRTGQMLIATLGESARAETVEELASKLIGKTFAAQIGTSKDGQYSRVVHDTISPAAAGAMDEDAEEDHPDENFDDLPF